MSEAARISLCMIVRDEAAVLERCLLSAQHCYDELCIVDTGSRDGTPDIARAFDARLRFYDKCNGIDGRINHFAMARNAALDMAAGEWVLQLDADEIIRRGADRIRGYTRHSTASAVAVRLVSDSAAWLSTRLFRRVAGSRYRGRIHEYIEHADDPVLTLSDEQTVIENLQNKVGKESSAQRNMRLLELAIRDEPDNARNYHYLGNELRELKHFDAAASCYRKALELGTFPLGRFHSAYYLAICELLMHNLNLALQAASRALDIDSRYAEAPCLLADIYSELGDTAAARHWYRAALAIGHPPPDAMLAIQAWAYHQRPRARLAALDSETEAP
jgi:glycosyltransferase involved in cell wall biosynthesis